MLTVEDLRRWIQQNPSVPSDTPVYFYAPDWSLLKRIAMTPVVRPLAPYDDQGLVFYAYDRPDNEGKV